MNEPSLTAKQQGYAQDRASGMSQSDSLRNNYHTDSMTPKSVWENASKLEHNAKVMARIQQLRQATEAVMVEKRALTAENLVDEAFENLAGARRDKQWGSANGAVEWIGRATGLVSDKQQPSGVAVTKIVINLAPGVEIPAPVVEATEFREVEENGGGRDE